MAANDSPNKKYRTTYASNVGMNSSGMSTISPLSIGRDWSEEVGRASAPFSSRVEGDVAAFACDGRFTVRIELVACPPKSIASDLPVATLAIERRSKRLFV